MGLEERTSTTIIDSLRNLLRNPQINKIKERIFDIARVGDMKNLESVFDPDRIAVIGASSKKGSVGYGIFKNLNLNYEGEIYPVNPNRDRIQGSETYSSIKDIEGKVDLAIIAVPAKLVPKIVKECGESGVDSVIVVSSGFKEIGDRGKELEAEIRDYLDEYEMTLIGPNCMGVINTENDLNASFSSHMPEKGKTAVLSQSGALGSAIIEWSLEQNIGVSAFVSVGSMLDVNFGDLIKYFNQDDSTKSIVIYMESVKNSKKFLESAREFVKEKPIVVLKAGSTEAGRDAAVSHTGSLAGNEEVYKAAFKQNGILQIHDIDDVFSCLRTLSINKLPEDLNLAIVTNAGGAGVMAVDALEKAGGNLAKLNEKTIENMNEYLPENWSQKNPVDVLGDASYKTYEIAIENCAEDANVDGVLVLFTPQYSSDPEETAQVVSKLSKKYDKPIITSWIGPEGMDEASKILSDNAVPNYPTPEKAVQAFISMNNYRKSQRLLEETPDGVQVDLDPDKDKLRDLIQKSSNSVLSETVSKEFLEEYDIPVVETRYAETKKEAVQIANEIGFPVAIKIQSPDITHKTDAGGVRIHLHTEEEVREAFDEIMENAKNFDPDAQIEGVSVQEMVENLDYELIIGSKLDKDFGPVVMFGNGGTGVEIYNDTSIGIPPINKTIAKRVMEDTEVYRILDEGYRDRKPADIGKLEEILVKFSKMVLDLPEIKEIDINPLAVKDADPVALDARIILTGSPEN